MARNTLDPTVAQQIDDMFRTDFADIPEALGGRAAEDMTEPFEFSMCVMLDYKGSAKNMERAKNNMIAHANRDKPFDPISARTRKLANDNRRMDTIIVHDSNTNFLGDYVYSDFKRCMAVEGTVRTEFHFINYTRETKRTQPRVSVTVLGEEGLIRYVDSYRDMFDKEVDGMDKILRQQFQLKRTSGKQAVYEPFVIE